MKRAIITGADGFIGRNLVKEMLREKYHVYAIVMDVENAKSVLGEDEHIHYYACNMNNYQLLSQYPELKEIPLLFHFAWAGVSDHMCINYEVQLNNVKCTCDLQYVAKELGIKRIVFADSIMEYEHLKAVDCGIYKLPLRNTYHISKIAARNMLQLRCANDNIDFIPVLISNVYGVGENSPRLINTAIRSLLKNEHMSFSPGEQLYDFIYISDAVRAIRLSGEKGINNKIYYIGNDVQRPLKEYLIRMRDVINPTMELGMGELQFSGCSLDYTEFDTMGIFRDFGFVIDIPFEDGVKMTANWIRENEM